MKNKYNTEYNKLLREFKNKRGSYCVNKLNKDTMYRVAIYDNIKDCLLNHGSDINEHIFYIDMDGNVIDIKEIGEVIE